MAEHPRAAAAFDRYWRLGPDRTIERLRESMQAEGERAPSVRTLYEWSRRFLWQHRIQELEREAAIADHEQRLREVREMRERQVREGLLLQQQGASWLASLEADRVSAGDATRAIVEGARLEREARGALEVPEDAAPLRDGVAVALAGMTDDQLTEFLERMEGMRHGQAR